MDTSCEHLDRVSRSPAPVMPSGHGCQECLAGGGTWVHLRLCLTCGHVGCCDDSPNRHATRHFQTTGHPVIKSFEPGEDWAWCYQDDAMLMRIPAARDQQPRMHYAPPSYA
jgi:uncharacterized UBP type Zn finger protein